MDKLSEAPSLRLKTWGLLEDHLELGQLEARYECDVGRRRLLTLALAALCLASAFVFVQIALALTLLHGGLSLRAACLSLALLWATVGVLIYWTYGRRDPRVPEPFEGTRQELRRSLQWIRKHIS